MPEHDLVVVVGAGSTVGLSIADQSQPEGNAGSSPMLFRVSMDRATSEGVSFAYQTAPGTATVGTGYTSTSRNTQIPAGATSTTNSVPTIGDTVGVPDETFTVQLTGASSNAQIVRGTATAVSADGSIVAGTATDAVGPAAMIWTQDRGMRKLQDVRVGSGAAVPPGWRPTVATAIGYRRAGAPAYVNATASSA